MSVESTLAQVSAIRQALANPATLISSNTVLSGGTEAPAGTDTNTDGEESSFADALAQASGNYQKSTAAPTTPVGEPGTYGAAGLTGTSDLADTTGLGYSSQLQSADGIVGSSLGTPGESPGARILAIAESQLGQTEQPPGSNESPAIAQYRTATQGAIPGAPWCAYFASWVARQAGEPLGAQGQGIGDVSDVWSWAQSTGRAIPNGPGVVPKPGDLIVFGGEHVGIIRGILPNGQIATIEGNYENKVAANVRSPTEATGYVSMG
ncbi:MAG: CHAP domain-containing protein [Solirubrobacteraceae bacterium]